jgi:glycine oxidase
MAAPILILGQGLAGSVLAWEFERAGIDFEIVDRGHVTASSRIGAGIINPITGQRLVKSWQVDAFLPGALEMYRAMERALGVSLVREMRVRRFFRDERERRIFAEKRASGELAPYAGAADADGFWIEGAAQVDSAALIAGMRARLVAAGRLREVVVSVEEARVRRDLVIVCTGAALCGGAESAFGFAGMRAARGEILEVETAVRLEANAVLNDGHWLLPLGGGRARVGATFEPGVTELRMTEAARGELERSAGRLLGEAAFRVTAQVVGLRMTSADKHPVVGRSAGDPGLGIFNGLGSKGALLAPGLARQWVNHLTEAVPFDAAVDVRRFAKRGA